MTTTLLQLAEKIARDAHTNQFDKAGAPYIEHPLRVAARMKAAGYDEAHQAVGLLHDVIEDGEGEHAWTAEDLLAEGVPVDVVEAVVALTKLKGETLRESMARVMSVPMARTVKIVGDVADNADPERLSLLDAEIRERLEEKYRRTLRFLDATP